MLRLSTSETPIDDYRNRFVHLLSEHWALALALLVGIISLSIVVYYSNQPLLEYESFRQTQTAITVYWMIHEGWRLDYQTPTLGYPWSIPFEFPIYQSLVALLSSSLELSIDRMGRLVSFFFLLACGWPAYEIVRRLNWPMAAAWVFCALLWSSPLYLFYGRMFLMETAALFFALASIPYALDLKSPSPPWSSVFLFCLFATLAILQKITTALPVLIVMTIVLAWLVLQDDGWRKISYRHILLIVVAFSIPLIIGVLWTHYAGSVRARNLYGATTTFAQQSRYYFGTIGDRFDVNILSAIFWRRLIAENAAGVLGVLLIVVALSSRDRKAKFVVATCLVLFALPVLLFTRVHYFLPYYQSACLAFLLAALAFATVICLPQEVINLRIAAPVVAIILVIANFAIFLTACSGYVEEKINVRRNSTLAVSDVIRRYTPEDNAILVFGLVSDGSVPPVVSWSSEIAYYSRRKSFTVERSFEKNVEHDPASYLGGKTLGAMAFCDGMSKFYWRLVEKYSTAGKSGLFKVRNCYVWLPNRTAITLRDGTELHPVEAAD
jgi:hypothetical protein